MDNRDLAIIGSVVVAVFVAIMAPDATKEVALAALIAMGSLAQGKQPPTKPA
jgi:hypothetical protein